jgi:hypothetical protein
MLNKDQNQQGGENAINAQAGRDVIVQGVTYTEARQIAEDVYRANALELQGIAQRTATERIEHLVDLFLRKMQEKGAPNIAEATNPDFQHTLFEAQKAYARSGDPATEAVLVDLLAQRATETSRNLRQVVLTEAVTAVARLTPQQIDVLSLIFLVRHCVTQGLISRIQLFGPITIALRLVPAIPEGEAVYSYLIYAGVATNSVMKVSLQSILRSEYPGLLSRGFERPLVQGLVDTEPVIEQVLMPSEATPNLVQVRGYNEAATNALCAQLGISEHARFNLVRIQQERSLSDEEIETIFEPLGEPAKTLFRLWNSSGLSQHPLTAVGQAIAHANAVRLGLMNADLGAWIK